MTTPEEMAVEQRQRKDSKTDMQSFFMLSRVTNVLAEQWKSGCILRFSGYAPDGWYCAETRGKVSAALAEAGWESCWKGNQLCVSDKPFTWPPSPRWKFWGRK